MIWEDPIGIHEGQEYFFCDERLNKAMRAELLRLKIECDRECTSCKQYDEEHNITWCCLDCDGNNIGRTLPMEDCNLDCEFVIAVARKHGLVKKHVPKKGKK